MADEENSTKIDEPDELKLWRELISARDSLASEASEWAVDDHPLRQHARYMMERYGVPKDVHQEMWLEVRERQLKEGDNFAQNRAQMAQERLAELDRWISDTTRWKSHNKGRTLKQLEERVALLKHLDSKQLATDAIVRWLAERDNRNAFCEAALCLWRFENSAPNSTPGDFLRTQNRLNQLDKDDRATRIDGNSGMALIRAKRIAEASKKKSS